MNILDLITRTPPSSTVTIGGHALRVRLLMVCEVQAIEEQIPDPPAWVDKTSATMPGAHTAKIAEFNAEGRAKREKAARKAQHRREALMAWVSLGGDTQPYEGVTWSRTLPGEEAIKIADALFEKLSPMELRVIVGEQFALAVRTAEDERARIGDASTAGNSSDPSPTPHGERERDGGACGACPTAPTD